MYTPKKYFTNDYRVNSCFSEIWDGIYSCKCCWPEPFNSFLRPFKAVFIVTEQLDSYPYSTYIDVQNLISFKCNKLDLTSSKC